MAALHRSRITNRRGEADTRCSARFGAIRCSRTGRPSCAKAKSLAASLDGHLDEPRCFKPPREGVRVNRRVSVAQVDQTEKEGTDPIEASEDSTGAHYSPRLGQ